MLPQEVWENIRPPRKKNIKNYRQNFGYYSVLVRNTRCFVYNGSDLHLTAKNYRKVSKLAATDYNEKIR